MNVDNWSTPDGAFFGPRVIIKSPDALAGTSLSVQLPSSNGFIQRIVIFGTIAATFDIIVTDGLTTILSKTGLASLDMVPSRVIQDSAGANTTTRRLCLCFGPMDIQITNATAGDMFYIAVVIGPWA